MRRAIAVTVAMVLAFTASGAIAQETIKVGYLAALTGDWAAYGQTELKSAQLAVDEINGKGGVLGKS